MDLLPPHHEPVAFSLNHPLPLLILSLVLFFFSFLFLAPSQLSSPPKPRFLSSCQRRVILVCVLGRRGARADGRSKHCFPLVPSYLALPCLVTPLLFCLVLNLFIIIIYPPWLLLSPISFCWRYPYIFPPPPPTSPFLFCMFYSLFSTTLPT